MGKLFAPIICGSKKGFEGHPLWRLTVTIADSWGTVVGSLSSSSGIYGLVSGTNESSRSR